MAFVCNSSFAFECFFFTFRLTPWRWKQTNKACLQNAHSKGCWRPPYYRPPQAWSGAIGPSDDKDNNKRCLDTAKPSMRRAAELHRLIAAEYNIEFWIRIILTPKLLNQRTLQHKTRHLACTANTRPDQYQPRAAACLRGSPMYASFQSPMIKSVANDPRAAKFREA